MKILVFAAVKLTAWKSIPRRHANLTVSLAPARLNPLVSTAIHMEYATTGKDMARVMMEIIAVTGIPLMLLPDPPHPPPPLLPPYLHLFRCRQSWRSTGRPEPRTGRSLVPRTCSSRSERKQMVNRMSRFRRCRRRLVNKSSKCFNYDTWSLMHTNIRGIDSKVLSLQAVADRADIITVNETLLKNNRAMKLPGFTCYNRNR